MLISNSKHQVVDFVGEMTLENTSCGISTHDVMCLTQGLATCVRRHPVPGVYLSHAKYQLTGFRKSTPPQNRQLIV